MSKIFIIFIKTNSYKMDISQIKSKLAGLQPKPKYEKVDFSKIYWKPKIGKHQIRIVHSKFDKTNPFKEMFYHYGIGKGPIVALTNWGEQDPIVEFVKGLRKSSDKEDWQLAKKIEPKMRISVPIIVRGEEHLGVRLWEFGKENYQQLLGIAADEDYGDFTDVNEGRDFTIDGTDGEAMGRKIIKCAIRIKPKTSPLSTEATQVETWLSEQPDIMGIYRKYTFEELKDILQKWLNPEEEETDEEKIPTSSGEDNEKGDLPWQQQPDKKYSPDEKIVKKSNSDKFNSLFEKN